MAQSLSDVVLHIVFSTKERRPFIIPEIEKELYQYICGTSADLKCPIIKINGVEDHIHILAHRGRTISQSDLVSELKSSSSRWIKTKNKQVYDFSWQAGYGAFSVSRHVVDRVVAYIAEQKENHKRISFKEEFLDMLQRAKIKYDEKYLWD